MKKIFFDSSTIISIAMTCALGPVFKLQKDFGNFAITPTVKSETIDKALRTLKFKYEGFRLMSLLHSGKLKLYPEKNLSSKIYQVEELMNKTFFAKGKALTIMHPGEVSALIVAKEQNADAYAVDERTTRLLVESPKKVAELMSSKLHTSVNIDKNNLRDLKKQIKDVPIIRSTELALAAYKKGYFGKKNKELLEGVLWALKFNGCAISKKEIKSYTKIS
ncbi:hypothetical protein GF374_01615 [Candidatus Woesearchaeota archaeon]|nr:hypothetical protein [Candidatus Woesearchaeota archaeon]